MGTIEFEKETSKEIRMAELFAGVGGFRLGLEGLKDDEHPEFNRPAAGPFKTVWANQWEPPGSDSKQFAWRCYESHFGDGSCINKNISDLLDAAEAGKLELPEVDLVTAGFPCQDYSVACPLSYAKGIEGKKGILWWDVYRFLKLVKPGYAIFENVDRLLKSPKHRRGRDFAILLSCLENLGYSAEWRIINSAEYGFSQKRKRVFIVAVKTAMKWNLANRISDGILTRAFPIEEPLPPLKRFRIRKDPHHVSETFNQENESGRFLEAGVMSKGYIATCRVIPVYSGEHMTLDDVLIPEDQVPDEYYIPDEQLQSWRDAKGAKQLPREDKSTGFKYLYSEGAMSFPDKLDSPSRTILTCEGGRGISRTKHVILRDGKYRRLVPDELNRLQGFPRGWTDTDMTESQKAYCMGNALIVGLPHRIGKVLSEVICRGEQLH